MNLMKIVSYKSAKAFYFVEYHTDQTFIATLEKYMGDAHNMPPKTVTFIKQGQNLRPGAHSLLEDVTNAVGNR